MLLPSDLKNPYLCMEDNKKEAITGQFSAEYVAHT